MVFFNKVLGIRGAPTNQDAHGSGGSSETCPSCGSAMEGDGHFAVERFECPSCAERFYKELNGVLTSYTSGSDRTCISCQQLLEGSELTAEWEDGDNADAYITCRHCGTQNLF